jgi:hypothetical protein
VELGKALASGLLPMVENADSTPEGDASTQGLLKAYRAWSKK